MCKLHHTHGFQNGLLEESLLHGAILKDFLAVIVRHVWWKSEFVKEICDIGVCFISICDFAAWM